MILIGTKNFDSTYKYTPTITYNLTEYENYNTITTDDIYIVVDAIALGGSTSSNTGQTMYTSKKVIIKKMEY